MSSKGYDIRTRYCWHCGQITPDWNYLRTRDLDELRSCVADYVDAEWKRASDNDDSWRKREDIPPEKKEPAHKMSTDARNLLLALKACKKGKGLPLASSQPGLRSCHKNGWVLTMGVPGLMVSVITDDGRTALAKDSTP